MQIAIFHYHLNPGGVTRIIESQVAGFKKVYPKAEITVISGHCENPEYYAAMDVALHTDASLNYLIDKDFAPGELENLYQQYYNKLRALLPQGTILHVHNLNLGKNPVLTLVFHRLLQEGYAVMNHAHDFSEDRPVNQAYLEKIIKDEFAEDLKAVLYPKHPNYLVGVLNRFDYERVVKEGVEEERTFLFPNPVYMPVEKEPQKAVNRARIVEQFKLDDAKKILCYPVRVIRRKNIGELILLSALYPDLQVLVTLAPRNPVEISPYEKWKVFCEQHALPITFEAGEHAHFIDIINGSDYCITTSVQEGFGMAFLEPWLIGTPVIGRDIPYVTRDLKQEGVDFPFLYPEIKLSASYASVEFSSLELLSQQSVIEDVLLGKWTREEFVLENQVFKQFPPSITQQIINENKERISKNFSIEEYAKRIYTAYQRFSG